MRISRKVLFRALLVAIVGLAIVVSSDAYAKKPISIEKCPRNVYCLDVWDPVICDDGVVYSNGCYAWRACATGCEPYGDGGPISIDTEKKKPGGIDKCPRDVYCFDLWDPVICDDGEIYSNACYAWRACATGCEPYGDGGPIAIDLEKKKPGGISIDKCPRDVMCLDVWDPVICDDGEVYSNACYAWRECATGCEPYGDGGPIAIDLEKKKPGGIGKCPRDVMCLDVWDPVICDDGEIYSNACYAWRECATGCEPYGDGGPISIELKKKPGGFGKCPRDVYCLDVWDPVICDDGLIYSNDCYAWRACATGCEPYGFDGPISVE